jgi:hypothetical protein
VSDRSALSAGYSLAVLLIEEMRDRGELNPYGGIMQMAVQEIVVKLTARRDVAVAAALKAKDFAGGFGRAGRPTGSRGRPGQPDVMHVGPAEIIGRRDPK